MADSIEIRLEQLTQAIKGLYAKSSMSQGEIYNALTSLSQRYENLTTVSSEKIASTLVNEFRKSLEAKYGQTNQFIKELESALNTFMANQGQNPQLSAEITKLLADTSNTYAKLNSQDLALQKIFNVLELQKDNNPREEIIKLSDNFLSFSRGFENITTTLNKNFADFLNQIKQGSTKEEFYALQGELDTISGNINSIISAISIIDSKYKDLTGLIDTIGNRENIFNDALREVRNLTISMTALREEIYSLDSKTQLQALNNEIQTQIETVKYEIQKIIQTATDTDVKTEIKNLNSGLKDIFTILNGDILDGARQNQADFERYLNCTKEEIKNLLLGLSSFKKDLNAINEGNIKILQEPIERALDKLNEENLGKNINELSEGLKNITLEIKSSIQNLQLSLDDINSTASMQSLEQIAHAIPSISDKLEIFRNHVVSENSANLGEIKNSFSNVIATLKENLINAVEKIQDDTKTISQNTMDTLKVDLQRLSDNLMDSIDNINEQIQREFAAYKTDFEELSVKQQDTSDKITEKLSVLEIGLENFSADTIEKLNDTINANSAHAQDSLNEIKSDIIDCILNFDKTNKDTLSQFETKIDKVLDNYIGADLDNIIEKKSLRETVVDIETKIERTNLQQIHNAKELLEEIQSGTNDLSMKIAALDENKNMTSVVNAMSKISEKLQSIEDYNVDIADEVKSLKEQLEKKLKDNVQKISALLDKPDEIISFEKRGNNDLDNLSNKVSEYLSNFEFLKGNISQEIKENLESEFSKLESLIKKLRSTDENSNYSYTLEDVESDLAKIRLTIEKNAASNEDFKNLFEKIIELRSVGLENVKINRDLESELGNISGWFKDTVGKIDDLAEKVEDMQSIGFEDIKTRLIQSEKSKNSVIDLNVKIENALKHLLKNSQYQDSKINELNKKVELLTRSQKEGFNPAQFIDIFYENMTQTKMLTNRVEIIEDKINAIQNAVEKLISYVEQ